MQYEGFIFFIYRKTVSIWPNPYLPYYNSEVTGSVGPISQALCTSHGFFVPPPLPLHADLLLAFNAETFYNPSVPSLMPGAGYIYISYPPPPSIRFSSFQKVSFSPQ